VTELKAKHPDADLSPSATRGECFNRAARLDFKRDKGGMYSSRDKDGTEVLVYYNDTAHLICCTELCLETRADDDE
jgi:hypothetical protein